MTTNCQPIRLAKEMSPYLLQHQYNPVDWFPWSEEAPKKSWHPSGYQLFLFLLQHHFPQLRGVVAETPGGDAG
ncbi:thioredoxin domain-containing protein [Paenibacillus chitinolyticus]|nr:DUF255 domain-containing protein [Paenibacillus chitinolyticus]MBV6714870.1 thioredoxin domain-containing protein [Paenibacillus chitinolyticus]